MSKQGGDKNLKIFDYSFTYDIYDVPIFNAQHFLGILNVNKKTLKI